MISNYLTSNGLMTDLLKTGITLVVCLSIVAYHTYEDLKNGTWFRFLLKSTTVFSLIFFSVLFYQSILPKEWDFTCFYLFGKIARYHLDFYQTADYYKILPLANIPFELSQDFKTEVLNVGCLYPPPTLFLFLPLGYLPYQQAMLLMYVFILLSVIACIILLKHIFFTRDSLKGWMISIIFTLMLIPLLSTVIYTQICILLLLLLLLTFYTRNKPVSGVFLSLAIFVKPFVLILLFWYILRKQWKALGYFILTCAVIGLISVAYFGIDPFLSYLFSNPSKKLPSFWYSEMTNQSLLSELYRLFPSHWETARIINYTITCTLIFVSSFVAHKMIKTNKSDLLFPLLLVIVLIIYPNGQIYYPIVHILSILAISTYIPDNRLKIIAISLFFFTLIGHMLLVNSYLFVLILIVVYYSPIREGRSILSVI
jgi:hypothetical protein